MDTLRLLTMPGEMIRYIGIRARQRLYLERALKQGDRKATRAALEVIRSAARQAGAALELGYKVYGDTVIDRRRLAAHVDTIGRCIEMVNHARDVQKLSVEKLVRRTTAAT